MASFHDDEIRDIYAQFEITREIEAKEREQRKADCLEFLRKFNDVVHNVILPVFSRAQEVARPPGVQSRPKHDHKNYAAAFEVLLGDTNLRSLVFDAKCEKARVTITHNSPNGKPDRDVKLSEITPDLVEQELRIFLRAALEVR